MNNTIGILRLFTAIYFSISGLYTYGCEPPKDNSGYPHLEAGAGYISFEKNPLPKDESSQQEIQEYGIDLYLYGCTEKTKTIIGELPYLAETGQVKAAFLVDANGDGKQEAFVIHSASISSDTGMPYVSDYYSIHVYQEQGNTYVRNQELSSYFGAGGDILDDPHSNKLKFEYPYKSEQSIRRKILSENFIKWTKGETITIKIAHKLYFYSYPIVTKKTKIYVIPGDVVKQLSYEGGWILVSYQNSKKGEIKGWIKCSHVNDC